MNLNRKFSSATGQKSAPSKLTDVNNASNKESVFAEMESVIRKLIRYEPETNFEIN